MTNTDSILANQSVLKTNSKPVPFDFASAGNSYLFCVPAGVDPVLAASKAWALETAVRDMLELSVQGGGMDSNLSYLCEHAMNAAIALRQAVVSSKHQIRALESSVRDVLSAGAQNGIGGGLSFICQHAMTSAIDLMDADGEIP